MPITDKEVKLIRKLKSKQVHITKGWKSFNHDNALPNAIVIDIDNIPALQHVMQTIYALNEAKPAEQRITIRAAAGGIHNDKHSDSYSFSPVAAADIIVRLTGDDFRKISKVDGKDNVMHVGASLQIGEVDKQLYNDYSLVLPTSSLIPYVTVAGLSATAGHGTGKDQPGFAGLIRAMTLCLPDGKIVRIDETHPDFNNIRGSHLGLFGIVLNVELACMPAKKIKATIDVTSIPELLEKINSGLLNNYPYVSIMYVPTYHDDELTNRHTNNAMIQTWEPVDKDTPNQNHYPTWQKLSQFFSITLEDKLDIVDLLRVFPNLVPYYMRYFASQISIGDEDRTVIGPWHELAHYQTAFPWDLTEYCPIFEVSKQGDDGKPTPEIAAALTKLVTTLTENARHETFPLVYAAYLRYFQGTNGGLSMSMHHPNNHIAALDMTTAHCFPGFGGFANEMKTFAETTLHAKTHWGKNLDTKQQYQALYGDAYQQFIHTLESWHQEHHIAVDKNPFINATLSQLFYPESAIAAPTSTPISNEIASRCTTDKAIKTARKLLKLIRHDQHDEAKALCNELDKVCDTHQQHRFCGLPGILFSCLRPSVQVDAPRAKISPS